VRVVAAILTLGAALLQAEEHPRPPVLVHAMAWFEADHDTGRLGWHWTMGRGEATAKEPATHDRPLIDPYDSADPWVAEYQALTMKLAGIDGAIIDWYGTDGFPDYRAIHRGTARLVAELKKARLTFAICLEDRAWKRVQDEPGRSREEALESAQRSWKNLAKEWLSDPDYLRVNGRPQLLVFGPLWMREPEVRALRDTLPKGTQVLGLPHLFQPAKLDGAFAWIPVAGGRKPTRADWTRELSATQARTTAAVVFPGYHDCYAETGQGPSYGFIPRDDGKTLEAAWDLAVGARPAFIQIATWNDYGEGTAIEPAVKEGYKALEQLQVRLAPQAKPADLRLPLVLLELRRKHPANAQPKALDAAARLMRENKPAEAARLLDSLR
jgi:hypothetical protein